MTASQLQIGEVAALAGVSIDTVRYYERQRLLERAPRSAGGFRLFTPEAVERIRLIKQAQEIGLSLAEIKELLTTGGAAQCQRVRDLLQEKLLELDKRIRAMRDFRRTLAEHLAACEAELNQHGAGASCPVLVKFARDARKEEEG
ncbi:MAG TPA: heavy metal-responsive transcriptional regulator [Blastocatellia bacterium]|nr:heavy metal-responsive transcriptional regulator [Blastocatellia bacterium]